MTMDSGVDQLIARVLEIPQQGVTDELSFQSIPQWDSLKHLELISALEEAYDVEIEAEQIVELSQVAAIRAFVRGLAA